MVRIGGIFRQVEVSGGRTDDMVRMFFHLRYDVRNTTTFSRLALFQMGADWYSYHDVFDAFVVGE